MSRMTGQSGSLFDGSSGSHPQTINSDPNRLHVLKKTVLASGKCMIVSGECTELLLV